MDIKVNLTKDQANALLQLLDVAIKAGGYQNAKAGVVLIDIILQAAKEADQPQPVE